MVRSAARSRHGGTLRLIQSRTQGRLRRLLTRALRAHHAACYLLICFGRTHLLLLFLRLLHRLNCALIHGLLFHSVLSVMTGHLYLLFGLLLFPPSSGNTTRLTGWLTQPLLLCNLLSLFRCRHFASSLWRFAAYAPTRTTIRRPALLTLLTPAWLASPNIYPLFFEPAL